MRGRIWQNSSFLDHILIPLLASTMHAAWVVPMANALFGTFMFAPRGVTVPVWLPVAVLYAGSTLARLASPSTRGRALVAAVGVVTAVAASAALLPAAPPGTAYPAYYWGHLRSWAAGIPGALGVFALVTALWLRAVTVDWVDADSLRGGLLAGASALGLLALLGATSLDLALGSATLSQSMLLFVLSALAALAFSDISRTVAQSRRNGGAVSPLGRYWFGTVALAVGAVVAVAWLVGVLTTPDAALALVRFLGPVLRLIRDAFAYVVMAVAYAIFWLLGPLIDWLMGLVQERPTDAVQFEATTEPTGDLMGTPRGETSVTVPPWVQYAVVAIVLALVAYAIYRAVRRRRTAVSDGVVETRELDWSWGQMREQLLSLLRGRRPGAARTRYLPLDTTTDTVAAIRLAYRRLLTLADESGLGHTRGQTPSVYGTYLSQAMPEMAEPIGDLTSAYVLARYGPRPPAPETMESAVSAAKRLEEWLGQNRPAQESDAGASPSP